MAGEWISQRKKLFNPKREVLSSIIWLREKGTVKRGLIGQVNGFSIFQKTRIVSPTIVANIILTGNR